MSGRQFEIENWHLGKRSELKILSRYKNRSFKNTYILAKVNKECNGKQSSLFKNSNVK
jgi:hypothetical protein